MFFLAAAESTVNPTYSLIVMSVGIAIVLGLIIFAKANAFMNRRGFVIPEDVRAVAMDVMRHRIGLTFEAEAEEIRQEQIVTEILDQVEVP